MKKTIITILVTVIITTTVIVGAYLLYPKFKNKDENNENETENETIFILDGNGMEKDYTKMSLEEWTDIIENFYINNYNFNPERVVCSREKEQNIIHIKVYNEGFLIDEFTMNSETGLAVSTVARDVNFIEGRFVDEVLTKVTFEGDECLAVGFIAKGQEYQIRDKYFNNQDEYEYLTTVNVGDACQFIVIPKSRNATLKIYTYNISIDGELYLDEFLTEAKGTPLFITSEDTEVLPRAGVVYECDGTNFTLPLLTDGKDGKIIVLENENLIKDISIY